MCTIEAQCPPILDSHFLNMCPYMVHNCTKKTGNSSKKKSIQLRTSSSFIYLFICFVAVTQPNFLSQRCLMSQKCLLVKILHGTTLWLQTNEYKCPTFTCTQCLYLCSSFRKHTLSSPCVPVGHLIMWNYHVHSGWKPILDLAALISGRRRGARFHLSRAVRATWR